MTLPELFEMLNMSLSAPLVSVVETWAAGTPFNTPANETLFFFADPASAWFLFASTSVSDGCDFDACVVLSYPREWQCRLLMICLWSDSIKKKKTFHPGLQNFAPSHQMFISITAATLLVSGAVTGSLISSLVSHFVPLITFLLANRIYVPKRGHKSQRKAQSTCTASSLRFNMWAHMGVAGIRTSSQPFFDFFWGYTVVWGWGYIGAELWTTSQKANSFCWGATNNHGDILWLKT